MWNNRFSTPLGTRASFSAENENPRILTGLDEIHFGQLTRMTVINSRVSGSNCVTFVVRSPIREESERRPRNLIRITSELRVTPFRTNAILAAPTAFQKDYTAKTNSI